MDVGIDCFIPQQRIPVNGAVACTRFRRHRVRCFYGTGGVGVDGPCAASVCQDEAVEDQPYMERITRIGMDTSKHLFQVHGVNAAEELVLRKTFRRRELIKFFEKLPPTVIGIEGGRWIALLGRLLQSFGHDVKVLPPAIRQAYVKRGKNDASDPSTYGSWRDDGLLGNSSLSCAPDQDRGVPYAQASGPEGASDYSCATG
jgi:hypothetical protein